VAVARIVSPDKTVIDDDVEIGADTVVWHFAIIRTGVRIGRNCAIGSKVYVGHQTKIGDNVRVQDGAHLTNHMQIGDDVFIGPGVVTMCDRYPRALNPTYVVEPIILEEFCSIGAGCVILPGVRVGHHAMIGAGSVIHRDVPPLVTVYGNPARVVAK
jgi:UDP-2-acetamido-3-amino-2,3-dideoxy-glucuronate N-acetyltransferase